MDFKPRRSGRNTNIDGFIGQHKKQTPAFSSEHPSVRDPLVPAPEVKILPKPIVPVPQDLPITTTKYPFNHVVPPRRSIANKRWKKRLVRSSIVAAALMLIVGGWVGSRLLTNVDKVFHGSIVSDVQALSSTTKLKGESSGRINFLLAGDSEDDPGHQGADLTDSIMVVSIDTQNHTGFMLSIPRDMWVDIPGIGHEKINAANDITNFNQPGYPSGGMGQLEQIVTTDFGIPIDYYGLIDYTAFRDAVNAVGGISITIQSPDPRGLYDAYTNLKLPNGMVTLDGQQALNLARARGDDSAGDTSYGFPDSDYDRTEHQRQMLVALEQKASTVGVVSDPLKIGQLFNAVGNNVQTDMNLADVLRLTQITKGMSVSSLQSLTLADSGTNPLLADYTAPDGEEALIPSAGLDDFSQIQTYYQELTSGKANTAVITESPSVVVLNGSDVDGLARKEADILQSEGFNVVGVTDSNAEYPGTEIIDLSNGKMPAAKAQLAQTFKSDTTTVTSTSASPEAGEADGYNANFVVVLGQNWDTTAGVSASDTKATGQ
jgi:LCP family protein required for cell wall assembly